MSHLDPPPSPTLVSPDIDREEYSQGRCHIFAMALHKAFGYQIKALWDLEPVYDDWETGPAALVHMYCEDHNGVNIDIQGIMGEGSEAMHTDFLNVPDYVSHDYVQVLELVKEGVLDAPREGEMEQLASFLSFHRGEYTPTQQFSPSPGY